MSDSFEIKTGFTILALLKDRAWMLFDDICTETETNMQKARNVLDGLEGQGFVEHDSANDFWHITTLGRTHAGNRDETDDGFGVD